MQRMMKARCANPKNMAEIAYQSMNPKTSPTITEGHLNSSSSGGLAAYYVDRMNIISSAKRQTRDHPERFIDDLNRTLSKIGGLNIGSFDESDAKSDENVNFTQLNDEKMDEYMSQGHLYGRVKSKKHYVYEGRGGIEEKEKEDDDDDTTLDSLISSGTLPPIKSRSKIIDESPSR